MMTKRTARRAPRAGRSAATPRAAEELTGAELERIAERVLKLSNADEIEVEIDATADALTRFANNVIHQNVADQTLSISVRAVVDGRTAAASMVPADRLPAGSISHI